VICLQLDVALMTLNFIKIRHRLIVLKMYRRVTFFPDMAYTHYFYFHLLLLTP